MNEPHPTLLYQTNPSIFNISRFGRRVSRAFSFNRTPRKLRRAMSSMTQVMSPFSRRDSMTFAHPGSVNTITPRKSGHELRQRIASTNDLTVSVECANACIVATKFSSYEAPSPLNTMSFGYSNCGQLNHCNRVKISESIDFVW